MSKIIVIVDMQNDFITGSLGSNSAKKIVSKIENKIKKADEDTVIIFTQDTHFENYLSTREGEILPVKHCIKSTEGWEIHKNLLKACKVKPITILKPTFGSYDLIRALDLIVKPGDEIEFCGVCTDICVVSNAIMAKAKFYDIATITVDAGCCAGTSNTNHLSALQTMKCCQINVCNW